MAGNALLRFPRTYAQYLLKCEALDLLKCEALCETPETNEQVFNRVLDRIKRQLANLSEAMKEGKRALQALLERPDISVTTFKNMLRLDC